jgi:hypothetical protein
MADCQFYLSTSVFFLSLLHLPHQIIPDAFDTRRLWRDGRNFIANLNDMIAFQMLSVLGPRSNHRSIHHALIGLNVRHDMVVSLRVKFKLIRRNCFAIDIHPTVSHVAATCAVKTPLTKVMLPFAPPPVSFAVVIVALTPAVGPTLTTVPADVIEYTSPVVEFTTKGAQIVGAPNPAKFAAMGTPTVARTSAIKQTY